MDLAIFPQLFVNSLISGSLYALVSAGLSLNYGILRVLNFAHGHIMMVGAYTFYFFFVQLDFGGLVAALSTVLVSSLVSMACLKGFVRPFTRFSFHLPLVTTLALATMLESLISLLFGVNVKSLSVGGVDSYEFMGIFITPVQIWIIVSAVVLLGAVAFFVHATSLGRCIRALREHPQAAQSLGISDRRVTGGVFLLATLLATFAGVMIGIETNIQPTMGNAYTIKAFAAMILGGLGNVWGTVVGAFMLGFVENFSIGLDFWGYSLPAGYKDAFAFVIILLVLLVKPTGLFGTRSRVV